MRLKQFIVANGVAVVRTLLSRRLGGDGTRACSLWIEFIRGKRFNAAHVTAHHHLTVQHVCQHQDCQPTDTL